MPQLTIEAPTQAGWTIQMTDDLGSDEEQLDIDEMFDVEEDDDDDWSAPAPRKSLGKTKMKKKASRITANPQYEKMRKERLNLLLTNPLDGSDKQLWVRDPKNWTSNKEVPPERVAWAFHDVLSNAGIPVQRWTNEIYLEVGVECFPAYVRAIQYFTCHPPRIEVAGSNGRVMVISSQGFKQHFDRKSKHVIMPGEIANCADLVTRMDETQRCSFSQRLRKSDMELFMWTDGNAAPFRPKCIAQKSQKS